jgi:T1SS-143 domain-containing protein
VLGNDTDPDGDTLTLTNASVDPAKGSVTFTPDGTLTFNPAANVNGQVVVTYTIADHQGGSATSTVTIDVNPVNDAPVAVNDSASTSEDSPVSRTAALGVLANDNDIDSTGLSVSGVRVGTSGAFAAPGASGITLTGTYGSLLIRADGSYTYTPGAAAQALNTGASVQDVFSYQLSDGSLTAVANLSITVTGANDAPVVGTATVSVSEEGLAGGIADTTGTTDTTDLTTAGSVISVADVDGDPLSVTLTAPTTALTSNGVAITWTGSGTQTLIGSAGSLEIVRATIANDGTQSVTLSGPIDHPNTNQEDVLTLNLGVNVSDGVTTTTSTLAVRVEDDAPKATSVTQAVEVPPQDTNLLIILDNSGSMNTADGVGERPVCGLLSPLSISSSTLMMALAKFGSGSSPSTALPVPWAPNGQLST